MGRFTKLGILSLAALLALGACSKGSQSTSTTTTTTEQGASAAPSENAMSNAASPGASIAANGAAANDGGKVYQTNCSSCHQATGQGVEGTFPPLAGNSVVTGDPKKVIMIVKYGLNGKIEVKGHAYNGMMPAWGQQLSNADVATVVTYIRSQWGNTAGPVTEAEVAAVKK